MHNGLLASRPRFGFLGSVLVAACFATTACGSGNGAGPDGGGGGGDGGGGGSDGGGDEDVCTGNNAAGAGDAWAAMPLVNDNSNPDRIVTHVGNDIVSGIYYESASKGYIVSQDDGLLNGRGGAVFQATGTAVTSVAFSGDNTGIRHDGTIDFVGIEKSPTGYIAMAYASEVISSDDGGATFQLKGNAAVSRFSIDRTLAYQVTATGTTLVVNNGVISSSSAAPGPNASYDDIWQSSRSRPESQCQDGPQSGTPTTRYGVHVSPDRGFVAYTSAPSQQPTICVSTDGGRSFTARALGVSSVTTRPTGVVFMTKKRGIAWFGSTAAGSAYVKRTTDGGVTWTSATLPADLAGSALELPAGFVGTDCMHGWLAGYDHTASKAVLLATTDGGATWTRVAGVAEAAAAAGGDKLYSGFALDTAHIWLGGSHGLVLHN